MKIASEISQNQINKRRYSAILILCIFSTQVSTAAILDNLNLITDNSSGWSFFYYFITFFAAIIQAGFSDDFGRKKHLLIASSSVLLASFSLVVIILLKSSLIFISLLTAIPCIILGAAGNAIPIARGCLATLKNHDFRSLIALTTICIDLGWITVNGLGIIWSPIQVISFSFFIQLAASYFIYKFYRFKEEHIKERRKIAINIRNSFKWLLAMIGVTGGAAAILAYLFSETSFYLPYILDELPGSLSGKKAMGLLMGLGYAAGVFSQIIMYPSDKNSIKFGVAFSFVFIIPLVLLGNTNNNLLTNTNYSYYLKAISQFFFAYGFGFFVPALFSLMAKKIHRDHIGRLFGVIDSTDTGALGLSYGIINLRDRIKNNIGAIILNTFILTIFLISMIMYAKFVKVFKSYEKES